MRKLISKAEFLSEEAFSGLKGGGLYHYLRFKEKIQKEFEIIRDEEYSYYRNVIRFLDAIPRAFDGKEDLVGIVSYEGKTERYESFYSAKTFVVSFPSREKDAEKIEAKLLEILKQIE